MSGHLAPSALIRRPLGLVLIKRQFAKNGLARLLNWLCGIMWKLQSVARIWMSGHLAASALIKRSLGLVLIKRPQSMAQIWMSGHSAASALIKRPLGLVLIKRQFAKIGLAWLLIN